jgi:hypothetical protein
MEGLYCSRRTWQRTQQQPAPRRALPLVPYPVWTGWPPARPALMPLCATDSPSPVGPGLRCAADGVAARGVGSSSHICACAQPSPLPPPFPSEQLPTSTDCGGRSVHRWHCEHGRPPRPPAALGWVLAASRLGLAAGCHGLVAGMGRGTDWCCPHLLPAFLGPVDGPVDVS